ncbi:MAG: hypothetical protein ACOC9B_05005 [Chloroflexota bacterium]
MTCTELARFNDGLTFTCQWDNMTMPAIAWEWAVKGPMGAVRLMAVQDFPLPDKLAVTDSTGHAWFPMDLGFHSRFKFDGFASDSGGCDLLGSSYCFYESSVVGAAEIMRGWVLEDMATSWLASVLGQLYWSILR